MSDTPLKIEDTAVGLGLKENQVSERKKAAVKNIYSSVVPVNSTQEEKSENGDFGAEKNIERVNKNEKSNMISSGKRLEQTPKSKAEKETKEKKANCPKQTVNPEQTESLEALASSFQEELKKINAGPATEENAPEMDFTQTHYLNSEDGEIEEDSFSGSPLREKFSHIKQALKSLFIKTEEEPEEQRDALREIAESNMIFQPEIPQPTRSADFTLDFTKKFQEALYSFEEISEQEEAAQQNEEQPSESPVSPEEQILSEDDMIQEKIREKLSEGNFDVDDCFPSLGEVTLSRKIIDNLPDITNTLVGLDEFLSKQNAEDDLSEKESDTETEEELIEEPIEEPDSAIKNEPIALIPSETEDEQKSVTDFEAVIEPKTAAEAVAEQEKEIRSEEQEQGKAAFTNGKREGAFWICEEGNKLPVYLCRRETLILPETDDCDTFLNRIYQYAYPSEKAEAENAASPAPKKPLISTEQPAEATPSFETVNISVDMEEEPEKVPAAKEKLPFLAKLINSVERKENQETAQEDILAESEEYDFEDYTRESDAEKHHKDLNWLIGQLKLRLIGQGALLAIAFLFFLTNLLPFSLPTLFQLREIKLPYLSANMVLLVLASVLFLPNLKNGCKALVTMQGDSDGGIALAVPVSAIYLLSLLLYTDGVTSKTLIPTLPILLGMYLNTYGKYLLVKRTRHNFRYLTLRENAVAVKSLDHNESQNISSEMLKHEVKTAYCQPTEFFEGFFHASYTFDPGERLSHKMMVPGLLFTVITALLSLILSKSVGTMLQVIFIASYISVPLCNLLSVNAPTFVADKKLLRQGAMIANYYAAEALADCNQLVVKDVDLFPKHSVKFCVLRAFGYDRLDEAILFGAAVVSAAGGPLKDMFFQALQTNRQELPEVESVTYEEGSGLIGWVQGSRVLVGNATLLERHGVRSPSPDYSRKYIEQGGNVIYLSVGGELAAMLIMRYTANRKVAALIRRFQKEKIRLAVQTNDCNITPDLLERVFSLSKEEAELIPSEKEKYIPGLQKTSAREKTSAACSGSIFSLWALLREGRILRNRVQLATLLQTVGTVFGMLAVLLLVVISSVSMLSTGMLLLFEIFWTAAVLAAPLLYNSK